MTNHTSGRTLGRLLLIAHAFPPGGGGGVQRPTKFAKFLPRFGWDVTVLTTQEDLYARRHGMQDASLLAEIPNEVCILRAPSDEWACTPPQRVGIPGFDWLRYKSWRWWYAPDPSVVWARKAFPMAIKHAREHPFDLVMATSDPFSSLMLGGRIARSLRIPFVAELRDPWCQRTFEPGQSPGWYGLRLERKALEAAVRTILVTQGTLEAYVRAYPQWADRFRVIENGVDLEEGCREEPAPISRERFEIVFTGRFTPWGDPEALFRALALARSRSEAFATQARLVVAGKFGLPDWFEVRNRALAAELGIDLIIEERGYLAHSDAVRLQRRAAVLVSSMGQHSYVVGGKMYEYLAAGRPLLTFAPAYSDTAKVLEGAPRSVRVDPGAAEEAAAVLLKLFADWQRGELDARTPPAVPVHYTRANQARQLSELLAQVIGRTP